MSNRSITVIEPPKGWEAIDLRELWQYRELLYFLAWRDIKVRYKQSFLGIAWAILQPFVTMVVFTLIFGRMIKMEGEQIPYSIFAFIGLVIWTYFSRALGTSTLSLVANSPLLTKIYTPRAILPISGSLAALVDLVVSVIFMLGLLALYGYYPNWGFLWMLPFCLLAMLTAVGCGLWLSAINVRYRDIGQIVPFVIQIWFFLTPIVYPLSVLGEKWRFLFWLNPMTFIIDGFRWAVTDYPFPPLGGAAASLLIVAFLLVSGSYYFRRMESSFADVV
ncbi:MAG: ABC transporter permease [Candidatus Alcyoniella australis]|nr:ABC transporter permease [Candidatus Alcyoniella australis]